MNGTCYISQYPINEKEFEYNLAPVTIIDKDTGIEEVHNYMKYYPIISSTENEYWFTLVDVSESELRYGKIEANIKYICMMTGIDIDDIDI